MMKPLRWLMAGALTLACAGTAWAERAPTPEERYRIERVLKRAGYVSWQEIELDDGRWAVDEALGRDGALWDVTLDPVTLRIVTAEPS